MEDTPAILDRTGNQRVLWRKEKMIKEIVNDARNLINVTIDSDTKGMTKPERKAYDMGVNNTLGAIETVGEMRSVDTEN